MLECLCEALPGHLLFTGEVLNIGATGMAEMIKEMELIVQSGGWLELKRLLSRLEGSFSGTVTLLETGIGTVHPETIPLAQ